MTNGVSAGPLEVYFGNLYGEALDSAERDFFDHLRLNNGTFKTTGRNRLSDVDELVNSLISHAGTLEVMDVGVSSGVTTLDWSMALARAGIQHRIVASDLSVYALMMTVGRRIAILWEESGHPLVLQLGSRVVNPRRSARSRLRQSIMRLLHSTLSVAYRGARRLPAAAEEAPPAPWAVRVRRVQLISRRVRAEAAISIVVDDISLPGRFPDRFDICRVANLLNRGYFSDEALRAMAANVRDRLREGGLLVVCRTSSNGDEDLNLATVFRKTRSGLEIVARLNGGSDVERVLAPVAQD